MQEIIELAVNARGAPGQNSKKKTPLKRFSVILYKVKNLLSMDQRQSNCYRSPKEANNSIAEMYKTELLTPHKEKLTRSYNKDVSQNDI